MKLLDKLLLLTRFINDNHTNILDVSEDLTKNREYYNNQKRYWKDTDLYDKLDSTLEQMQNLQSEYNDLLSQINKLSNKLLRENEIDVLRQDYDRYENEVVDDTILQQRTEDIDERFIKHIYQEIAQYSDWRQAGLEMNPTTGILTRSIVACDPLYIYTGNAKQYVDKDSIKSRFNKFFSEKRLRFYNDLEELPQKGFGLITNINTYDFWPLDPIKEELPKIYNLLLPGGRYIFTYNDCEQIASLDLCQYRSYNTKQLMTSMVEMFGFNIEKSDSIANGSHSYMIVRRPGQVRIQGSSNHSSYKLSAPYVTIDTPPSKLLKSER